MLFREETYLFWVQFQRVKVVLNSNLTISVSICMANSFSLGIQVKNKQLSAKKYL